MDERTQSLLESDEPGDRMAGLRLVVILEDQESGEYAERLLADDPEPEVREHAARALGITRGGAATEPLAQAAGEDEDPLVRRTALAILGEIGEHAAAKALVPLLGRGEPQDRGTAIEALRACGDPSSAGALLAVASDPDPRLRVIALHAFAALAGDPAAGHELAGVAASVRADGPLWALPAAGVVLGAFVLPEVEAQARKLHARELERAVLRALELPTGVGTSVLAVLVGVHDRAEGLGAAVSAARELARRGDARGAPVLAHALYGPESRFHLEAACALAELAVSTGEHLLLRQIAHASATERPRVARALALLARPEGVQGLGALLAGELPADRRAAALAFATLARRDGVLELVRALDFAYRRERVEALLALRRLWPEGPEVPALASQRERAASIALWDEHFARAH